MEEIQKLYKQTQERLKELQAKLQENESAIVDGKISELLSIQIKLQEIMLSNILSPK